MAIIHNLIARFRADTGTFDRNIKKSRSHMTRFGRDVQRMGKQMLALAGIGGGLYAIQRGFKAIIKAASDAQETQAKFNTVFKNLSQQANTWAETFGKSVGRSEQSVKSWMARLQDTFVPLGIARYEAMELSKSLVSLAVDVASFNNVADADVIRDFTSALVGNHETVRKYGIIIGETAIKQEAMRKGLNKTYKELTDLEKVQLRYSLIQKGSTDAQGDALRTADSYANQMKRLRANISDLSTEIGGPFMQVLNDMITSINENSAAWENSFRIQTEGWAEILSGMKSVGVIADITAQKIRDAANITAQEQLAFRNQGAAMMGIRGRPGFGDERVPLPVGILDISPKQAQFLAEMRARAREIKKETELAIGPSERQLAIMEEAIEAEKGLQELRAIGRKRLFDGLIKEGEKRRQVVEKSMRIQEDIASGMAREFSNTIDSMIFEGKRFAEAMADMLRSVLRMITQIVMYEKIAKPIAAGMMGIPVSEFHSGGIVGQTAKTRKVPAMAFAGAPRLHGGLSGDEFPAILQRGEQVIPRGGGGMAPTIVINNNTGQRLKQEREPMFDGKQWVIRIVADDIQQGGTLRKMVQGIR